MRVISLSQVRCFFSLLSDQWWRERFSDELIVEFRIARVRRFRVYVDGFILEDRCRSLWVVEVVEEVGLVTCEGVKNRHGAILLIVRGCSGLIPRRFRPHDRWWARQRTGRQWERKWRRERERKKTKQGNNQRSNMWWHAHEWFCQTHVSHNVMCAQGQKHDERKSGVRCICLHPPCVTVDRYRL